MSETSSSASSSCPGVLSSAMVVPGESSFKSNSAAIAVECACSTASSVVVLCGIFALGQVLGEPIACSQLFTFCVAFQTLFWRLRVWMSETSSSASSSCPGVLSSVFLFGKG